MSTTRALQPEQDLEAVIRYGTKLQSSVMTLYRPSSGTMPVPLYERQTCHGPKQALWSKMGMSPDFGVVYSTPDCRAMCSAKLLPRKKCGADIVGVHLERG